MSEKGTRVRIKCIHQIVYLAWKCGGIWALHITTLVSLNMQDSSKHSWYGICMWITIQHV